MDLNRVISLDPVLVGRVLKLINSAYYGLEQQVTSLVRAMIMLGINTVKNLALSSAILSNLVGRGFLGLNAEGFWRHSLCVGVTAKLIARKQGIDHSRLEEFFTAGLLHDLGKIPLNGVLTGGYMLTIKTADAGRIPLFQAENERLGVNHCMAGSRIVKAWRLEGALGDVITYHHNYGEYTGDHRDVLCGVIAANYYALTEGIGFSGNRNPEQVEDGVLKTLGMDWEMFDEIRPSVDKEIEKAQIFLNL